MSRLLYVVPPAGALGGVARSAARMIAAMRAAGHAVCAVHPDGDLFPGDVRADGDSYRFGALEPARPADWIAPVCEAARAWSPSLIVGYYGTLHGYAAAMAAERIGVPAVLCLRGNDVDRDPGVPERRARLLAALERAAAVVTVSTEMASKVRALSGAHAHFVSNSVDTALFYPELEAGAGFRARHGLAADARVLGLFGEFKPKRGLDRLAYIDALSEVALARGQGWRVLLVGRVRAEVREQVAGHWLHIDYLRDAAELRAAYAACDAVAQPSHHDGMPNVVLEAMACARPVIASPVGGMPDIVRTGENGVLCRSDGAWDEALRLVAAQPEMGARARETVPSIDDERRAFEAVFASIL
ncbi:glycosyltransferase [Haliangium ochraceum]|uniref:Glycosyl transferase group 1 n=1 Tax=Haliangium ochraceum (strain DSM 14365 / JCM 11303 / SMP-2) TaxID=502025 RepID=D0LQG6_HALO1|nr:glycosyltransferase [Haliangium ochraceum]ACY18975.1 glycosyl transferase group 1 [Haliangium ochraceum DSM 14365]